MAGRGVGQHHGDLREALLDAALELVAGGNPSPSLREVARAAGVSPAAPYHHFRDREALLTAVAEQGFLRLERSLLALRAREPGPCLEGMVARYVRFALAHPSHYRTMFEPERSDPSGNLEAVARRVFGHLLDAVAAVTEGEQSVALARAREAWALVHGTVVLHQDGLLPQLGAPSSPASVARDAGRAVLRLVAGPAGH